MKIIREELKTLAAGPSDLRKFGLLVGGVFAGLGAVGLYRDWWTAPYFLGIGIILIALGATVPTLLRKVYFAWMAMALVLGLIVGTVLLTLFYFLVMTPVTWIAKAAGSDFMAAKWDRSAASYWVKRTAESDPKRYERQF